MEDAGLVCLLVADHVGSPAEEGPEVHVRVRGVADPALPRAGLVGGGGQQGGGQRVVEGPGEGVGRREAPHAAAHLHCLVLGDSVDHVLGVVTHGGVWRKSPVRHNVYQDYIVHEVTRIYRIYGKT